MQYRAEIDGLRALAVLPVIFFHAGLELFSGGFIGVDIFFVISGYLICSIILEDIDKGNFSIINFYERRARRILPALFFIMLLCLPFSWYLLSPIELKDFGQSLTAVSMFSSNFLFFLESGYFDTSSELKPLLHTWSLAVEEQYYILFPVFLIIFWRFGIAWVIFILLIFFFLSLFLAQLGSFREPAANFYLLPSRAWELLLGVFLGFYLKYFTFISSTKINQAFSLAGFIMVLFSMFAFNERTPFPSLYTLVPTIGTALLILSAVPGTIIFKLLTNRFLVGIGLISYSTYLWHQPIISFAKHIYLDGASDLLLFFLITLSLLLGWFSWRYIERPFRDKKLLSRKFIFLFAFLGIALFSSIGMITHFSNGFEKRVEFSDRLKNSFDRPKSNNCFDTSYNHIADNWGCYLGNKKQEVDFILFGDSHTLSIYKILDKIASDLGISVFYTGSSGCLPFLDIYLVDRVDQTENDCNRLNKRVFNLSKEQNIKGIIFSARWSYYTHGDYKFQGAQLISDSEFGPFSLDKSISTFKYGFARTIERYQSINVPIHIISQPPHQKYIPEQAYFKIAKGVGDIQKYSVKRSDFENLNQVPIDVFSNSINGIYLHSLIDIFCDQELCYLGEEDGSYYFDQDHLSSLGALKLSGIFNEILLGEFESDNS